MTKTFKNKKNSTFFENYFSNFKEKNLKNSKWFHENHISFPSFYKKDHKKIIDEYVRVILDFEKNYKL
jgi:dTDP-4-amino-4,6-dideoxygalactose transaminase